MDMMTNEGDFDFDDTIAIEQPTTTAEAPTIAGDPDLIDTQANTKTGEEEEAGGRQGNEGSGANPSKHVGIAFMSLIYCLAFFFP